MMVGFGAGPYFSGSIAELQTGTNYLLLAWLALNMKTNSAPPKYAMHQFAVGYNKGRISCINLIDLIDSFWTNSNRSHQNI